MADAETLSVYAIRAEDYAARFNDTGPGKHLSAFMADLPAQARVLDLGCGPGAAAAAMQRAGHDVEAWDASPEMAKIGKRLHGIDITIAAFDALTATETYDGIYANFSLLHAPKADMPRHLSAISRALKPGGLFHIGLKSGTGEKRDSIGRFYAYYTEAELTALLQDVGMTIETRASGEEAGLDGTVAPWIILKARKDD